MKKRSAPYISKLCFMIPPLFLISVISSSCAMLPMEEETLPPPVIRAYESAVYTYATVEKGTITEYTDISVSEIPANEAVLSFPISGILIKNIYVQVGDNVKTGDILAELDKEAIEKKIDDVQYNIGKVNLKLRQAIEMYTLEKKYSSENDASHQKTVNDLNTQLEVLNIELEQLNRQISERVLYATIDGTVTYLRKTSDGDRSRESERFITLTDKTFTLFPISGINSQYFKPGDKVQMRMSGSDPFEGLVVDPYEAGIASPRDDTAYVTILEMPTDVRYSSYATIRYVLTVKENVLYLTYKAINTVNDSKFVYMMEDNIKKMVPIEIGLVATDGKTEILSGLSEGDSVIIE